MTHRLRTVHVIIPCPGCKNDTKVSFLRPRLLEPIVSVSICDHCFSDVMFKAIMTKLDDGDGECKISAWVSNASKELMNMLAGNEDAEQE